MFGQWKINSSCKHKMQINMINNILDRCHTLNDIKSFTL